MNLEKPSPFLRLFIALAVPPEVGAEIGRAQERLKRAAQPGAVRWAVAEQFHVTLKFLGDVPAEQVARIGDSIAPVCANCPALRVSARGIGFFPNVVQPRVIWAGARDETGRLPDLHRQLEAALRWLGPAEKAGRFSGHITLGRFKPGHHASIPKVAGLAAHFHDRHFGDWLAEDVELVRSDLTATGALHTVLAHFALGGPPPR
jgi:2'-5' RNA ligase